ncbi:antibiotic biosynthesis monooxygenase [Sphingobacterium sp. KU25419]|nr:antibiotic biosynthesis monooxygenase [Sphingobacterium sp. KU25419]
MIAVIFEVVPKQGKKEEYLNIAKALRPELDHISGFISIERFQSLVDPKKILSLSYWENEESVREWRNLTNHRNAQQAGRSSVFDDYRLRVSAVIRDYGMTSREEAPADNIF